MDELLLNTPLVVVGRLGIDDVRKLDRAMRQNGEYVRLDLHVQEYLRPTDEPVPEQPLKVMFLAYPEGHPLQFRPDANEIRRHLGQLRIILLQPSGNRLFLASRADHRAVQPCSARRELVAMMARHDRCRDQPLPDQVAERARVDALIEQLAAADQRPAAQAWAELLRLEPRCIPALARHLEDQRPTGLSTVLIAEPRPDSTERLHVVQPQAIGDVVLLALHQVSARPGAFVDPTQMSCDARNLCVQQWRVIAHQVHAELSRNQAPRRPPR